LGDDTGLNKQVEKVIFRDYTTSVHMLTT